MNVLGRRPTAIVAWTLTTILVTGCPLPKPRDAAPPPRNPKAPTLDDFPEAIARATRRLEAAEAGPAEARAHLAIARLHASHRNPKPIYDEVLAHVEKAVEIDPAGAGADPAILDWLQVLRVLRRAKDDVTQARDQLEVSEAELAALRAKIDQLEALEREMIDRRRQHR